MFVNKVYYFIILLLLLAFYTWWSFYTLTPKNYKDYDRLMAFSENNQTTFNSNSILAEQKRKEVNKQFIFSEGLKRLQWRMRSQESEVQLQQTDKTLQLIERLHTMNCKIQEKISINLSKQSKIPKEPFQLLRCIEAKEAIYHYKNKQLVADNVEMKRYKLPHLFWSNSLTPYQPLMKSNMQKVEIDFFQKPLIKAYGLKAQFQDWE